jgi:serine/threonine-protein kinase RsbW
VVERFAKQMTENRVSYTLDSTLESVNQAEETARQMAAEVGFQNEAAHEIAMAVREAAVNAVLHGNQYDPAKKVRVSYEKKPGLLQVTVTDEGPGFEPEQLPDPLAPENLLKQSGRGIFLIRSYMNEVRFRRLATGMEMVMIKYLRGQAANGKESAKP